MHYDERNFGIKLQEVSKTKAQLLKRRILCFSIGSLFIAFLIYGIYGWIVGPPIFRSEYWYMGIVVIGVSIFLSFSGGIFIYLGITTSHSEAILYETGFVYTLGRNTEKIAFEDIAGTLFLAERSRPTGRNRTTVMMYTMRMVKKGGIELDIDDGATMFRNFREFYKTVDANFSEYLLRDITPQNVDRQTISFGDDLTLHNGHFTHSDKDDKETTFSLDDVLRAEHPAKPREFDVLRLVSHTDKELVKVRLDEMLNIQVLYHVIEMAQRTR